MLPLKSPEEILKTQRSLSVCAGARRVAGVLVIVATILMVVDALLALKEEADVSRAMKIPFTLAFVSAVLFVRSDQRLRRLQARLRS